MSQQHSQKPPAADIDLKIDIENFGPITKGSIHFKPLTIFIGPNNSGKSYAAMLAHSIIHAENLIKDSFGALVPGNSSVKLFDSHADALRRFFHSDKEKDGLVIPAYIIQRIHTSTVRDLFADTLESLLSRNFGSPVCDLVRARKKTAKITINSDRLDITIAKKLNAKVHNADRIKYMIKLEGSYKFARVLPETSDPRVISVGRNSVMDKSQNKTLPEDLVDLISKDALHLDVPDGSFYLPAGRSGILHGHRELTSKIVQNTAFGGSESVHTPKLTGLVSNFISDMILVENKPGPLYDLAEDLEKDLFHGSIKLHSTVKNSLKQIVYHSKYGKTPLHRASSTISEIVPLSMYLKYIVRRGSLLIIEEPEAHLHPDNQLILAKYIVRMIRAGLGVLVTTHSVFLLEQLGKFMLASKLQPNIRKRLGYKDYLLPEEVSPYVFVRDGDEHHRIVPVETDDEVGISQEEFVKISEQLHLESIKLWQYLPEEQDASK